MKKIFLISALLFLSNINLFSQNNHSYFAFSGAAFDILQKDKTSLEGRIEYRLYEENWIVQPFSGVMYNIHNALHIYAGFLYDIELTDRITLTPSFAPGFYNEGHSKKLGYEIQFRSQLEITFKNNDGSKIGFSFNHISNASLSESNPGVESFAITYVVPLFFVF